MKGRSYTRRKKIRVLFLFILFMGIIMAGSFGLYYVNNFSKYLFSKKELLTTERYEDTETLEWNMLDDVDQIFELTALSQVFGNRDEENIRTPLYTARINGTDYNLCLRDLQKIQTIINSYYENQYGSEGGQLYSESETWTEDSADHTGGDSAPTQIKDGSYEAETDETASSSYSFYEDVKEQVGSQAWLDQYLDQFSVLYAGMISGEDYDRDKISDEEQKELDALESEWFTMDNDSREAIVKANGWENYYGDQWPQRYALENSAEILIYPGQRVLLLHDYIQQKEIHEQETLLEACDTAQDRLDTFYRLKNRLDAEETNLRYIVRDDSMNLWESNTELPESELMKLEKYVSYESDSHRIHTNFEKAEPSASSLEYLSSSLVGTQKGASFLVALDTTYPVRDDYSLQSADFASCRPILILSLFAIIGGFLGVVPSFIYLLASVGHQEDYDGIWLDKFDQWPTEPAVALIIGGMLVIVWFGGILARVLAYNFFTSRMIYDIMSIISAAVSLIIGLIGFFSMVKRLKAGILWKNSLLRKLSMKIGSWIGAMVQSWPVSLKTAGFIVLYWMFTIPLCMFIAISRLWGSHPLYFTAILVFTGGQLGTAGFVLWSEVKRQKILEGVQKIAEGNLDYVIDENGMTGSNKKLVECINNIGAGLQDAVDTAVKSERMKADLITNVSHDIKTPLTSIINYVDLMKRENITNERLKRYLEVLDQKSQRLKNLTEDLVEASRASSGNLTLHLERLNFVELVKQACGEFEEKFAERKLTEVTSFPEHPLPVIVDGRRTWRIIENLFQNTKKYAMPGTRVYVSVEEADGYACFTMKNISETELNISAEELTERFIRGDSSRTTEGSGLGLSIAQSLTRLQNGIFEIYLNGDLFQVSVQFELAPEEPEMETASEKETEADSGTGAETGTDHRTESASESGDRTAVRAESPAQIGGGSKEEAEAEAEFLREAMEELKSSGLLKG